MTDDEKLKFIRRILFGEYRDWFNNLAFSSFEEFKYLFIRAFTADVTAIREELRDRTQRMDEEIDKYLSVIRYIARPGILGDQEIKIAFLKGIKVNGL